MGGRLTLYVSTLRATTLPVVPPTTSLSQNTMLPKNHPPFEPAFGKTGEQGVLYTSLAGLLNLLAIMDVLYCDPEARRRRTPAMHPHPHSPPAAPTHDAARGDATPPATAAAPGGGA